MTAPRWACALVRRCAPAGRAEDLVGDLEELHVRRRAQRGSVAAWLITSADAVVVSGALLGGRVRSGFEGAWLTGSELRLALRLMRRNPVMAITSVFALTVGIALATIGFTVVAAILRPALPFAGGDRFVEVRVVDARTRAAAAADPDLLWELRAGSRRVDHIGALRTLSANVAWGDAVDLVAGVWITPESVGRLPLRPALGRLLVAGDDETVAVLGRRFWELRFGGDPSVVGRRLNIAGRDRTIVGVADDGPAFPVRADVWLALPADARDGDIAWFGVLSAGADPEAASAELSVLAANWSTARSSAEEDAVAVDVRRYGEIRRAGWPGATVIAVLIGLLVVVAGNVANLVIARTAARRSELAVRTALGADRRRLIAQLSAEILALGLVSGFSGLWIARSALNAFMRSEGEEIPVWIDLGFDWRGAAFVVSLTLLATVVAGVLPALRATRSDPASSLRGRGATAAPFGRLDDVMIVLQVALSVGVLGASTMLFQAWRGAWSARALDVPAEEILAVHVEYAGVLPGSDSLRAIRTAVEAALGSLPGVVAVATATHTPGADAPARRIEVEGGPSPASLIPTAAVSGAYFDVLAAEAVAGRVFRPSDQAAGAPNVVVVNRPFADAWLGGPNAVGRRLRIVGRAEDAPEWRTVIGVVPDLGLTAMDPERAAGLYVPMDGVPAFRLLVRADTPAALAPRVRGALFALDPALAVSNVNVLSTVMQRLRRLYVYFAAAFTTLGAIVLLLSLTAMYAVLSFEVTRRGREIGIRVALGAGHGRIVRDILSRVTGWVAVGGVLGVGLGILLLLLARATLVLRFPDTGGFTFVVLIGGAVVAGAISAWVPARRVLAVRPMEALRAD